MGTFLRLNQILSSPKKVSLISLNISSLKKEISPVSEESERPITTESQESLVPLLSIDQRSSKRRMSVLTPPVSKLRKSEMIISLSLLNAKTQRLALSSSEVPLKMSSTRSRETSTTPSVSLETFSKTQSLCQVEVLLRWNLVLDLPNLLTP